MAVPQNATSKTISKGSAIDTLTMEKRKRPFWKSLLFSSITFLLLLLFIFFLGEVAVRAMVYLKSRHYPVRTTTADPLLGHRTVENFKWNGIVTDASGDTSHLHYSTDERGFRAFGDLNAMRKKVFFIGDSFTQAIEVSDDQTYFRRLGDSLNLEVFAYGARGYGTLQEWMILKRYLPEINPDIVVLQFCSNDFINNHFELEHNSLYNNNRRRRPYFNAGGKIEYAVPAKIGWDKLNECSLFFQFIFTRLERFLNQKAPETAFTEYHLEHEGAQYPPFVASVARTKEVLRRFRETLPPGTPLLVFTTHDDAPYFEAIGDICTQLDIPFVGYIPEAIRENGHNTLALDGAHWNKFGHRIAADILACELADLLESLPDQRAVLSQH